ncbi:SusC/RagA family TonB-linked outer membrane protein [Maribacter ulvicola]|uniref:TonB-linked outer membrane protein, SusC/RagA family n=1 Tax=Maribacter ulvicola TaxID=228959 RepID=A0A1N6RR71_9FLAO|nr:SusC/RagA family TonB-linked outer membrane protein [Maribacter ulvicola]SIQ31202.1 TonB-linked outer membrane protein, SusC/RagA family [Maribacter ulvicola]
MSKLLTGFSQKPCTKTKLSVLILLISLCNIYANTYNQNTFISLDFDNVTLKEVLNEIETTTEFRFMYESDKLDLQRKVTIHVIKSRIDQVLEILFNDTNIDYHTLNRQIILTNKNSEAKTSKYTPNVMVSNVKEVQQQVTGIVKDSDGRPLPGANILEKESTNGTQTDFDGNFSITVNQDAILVISYIGFSTQEVAIASQSNLSIIMSANAASLEEVILVGYGTQSRAKVTGAISSVDGEGLTQRPVTSAATTLQGQSPGLTIQNKGGSPGVEDVNIRIRGIGTLNNSNPLILIDGVEQSLGSVEPQNIESISILKDAASASIYGSRAANGVILVTTKRGTAKGITITYDAFVGVQNPSFFPEKADTESWLRLENEAQVNAGGTPTYSEEYIENAIAGTKPYEFPWANWEDGIFNKSALMQQHAFSISSGNERGRIFASLNYNDSDGIIQNFNNKRTTMLINADMFASEKLTFKLGLLYRNGNFSGPGHAINGSGVAGSQIIQGLLHINRNVVMEYPDGTYDLVSGYWNPHAMANEGETNRLSDDVVAQGGFEYKIMEDLSLEGNVTYKIDNQSTSHFMNSLAGMKNYVTDKPVAVSGWFATNELSETENTRRELSQRLYLNYDKQFDNHDVETLVGYEEIHNKFKNVVASRQNFFNNNLRDLNAGAVDNQRISGYNQEWRLRSFFGRLNYSFNDKYLIQGNIRYDGSSRFGDGNRWGIFPSISAGWNITNEAFIEDLVEDTFISNIKLRASWGQLGNQNIGLNRFRSTYDLNQGYQFGGNVVSGSAIRTAGNPNITWETSTMTNIGLDASFLNNRLSLVAEYFWKYTDDILLDLPISSTIGVNPPVQNAAAVSNNGYEIGINYQSVFKPDGFNYSIGLNFTDVINQIEDLNGAGPFFPDNFSIWTEGHSINTLRGLTSPGLYRTNEDLAEYPATINPNVGTGDIIYEDVNGDGQITQSIAPGGDQVIIGNEDPRYEFGLRFDASFKGFDFSMFWQGVLKKQHLLDGSIPEGPVFQNFVHKEMAERTYHPERNPNGDWPLVTSGNSWNIVKSDFWLINSKYARLKNFQLGYTFRQDIFSKFRLYISGENMLTITAQKLFDPETPRGRSQFFPHTKTISVGLNVVF